MVHMSWWSVVWCHTDTEGIINYAPFSWESSVIMWSLAHLGWTKWREKFNLINWLSLMCSIAMASITDCFDMAFCIDKPIVIGKCMHYGKLNLPANSLPTQPNPHTHTHLESNSNYKDDILIDTNGKRQELLHCHHYADYYITVALPLLLPSSSSSSSSSSSLTSSRLIQMMIQVHNVQYYLHSGQWKAFCKMEPYGSS